MSDNFDKLISEYREYAELAEYSRSQFRVITDLSKKIQVLEEENKTLKKITEHITPVEIGSLTSGSEFGSSDPEIIARTQLALLKKTSLSGEELTLDESRRAQIFSEILFKATEKNEVKNPIKDLDTKQLLALVENTNE